MKTIIAICITLVVLVGCTDRFTGPSDLVPDENNHTVVYTRLQDSYGLIAGAIVRRDIGTNSESVIVPKQAYLLCAPQNGKLLYAQYNIDNDGALIWNIYLGDINGHSAELVMTAGALSPFVVQDVVLSSDGRRVAYVVSEGINPNKMFTDRLYVYTAGSGASVVLDSIKQPVKLIGSGAASVDAIVSQIAFSPDGKYLVVALWGDGKRIRLYNLSTRTFVSVGYRTGPYVAWSADGRQLMYTQNVGKYTFCEMQMSMGGYPSTVVFKTGLPDSSALLITNADQPSITQTVVSGMPPVLEIAWANNGRVACSQARSSGSLYNGTKIVAFMPSNPTNIETLTNDLLPFISSRLQWSGGNTRLLYTQGGAEMIYSSTTPQYAGMNICVANGDTGGNQIIGSLACGVYWLNASASPVKKGGKSGKADSLQTEPPAVK